MVMMDLVEYRKVQQVRINKLMSGTRRGKITAAKYMTLMLRKLAPRDTGKLLSSIKRNGNTVFVSGSRTQGKNAPYPYIHWINETPEFNVTSKGKKYSDPSINRTGTPRFATIARNSARQKFNEIMLKASRKAIRLEA